MKPSHTTVRLSEAGRAKLDRLAALPDYGSQVGAMEAAIDLLFRQRFNPTSSAGDAVLENVRKHVALALAAIDGEFGRRAEEEESDHE